MEGFKHNVRWIKVTKKENHEINSEKERKEKKRVWPMRKGSPSENPSNYLAAIQVKACFFGEVVGNRGEWRSRQWIYIYVYQILYKQCVCVCVRERERERERERASDKGASCNCRLGPQRYQATFRWNFYKTTPTLLSLKSRWCLKERAHMVVGSLASVSLALSWGRCGI